MQLQLKFLKKNSTKTFKNLWWCKRTCSKILIKNIRLTSVSTVTNPKLLELKNEKTNSVFSFQKNSKFWSVSLDNLIKHKHLISEVWWILSCVSKYFLKKMTLWNDNCILIETTPVDIQTSAVRRYQSPKYENGF